MTATNAQADRERIIGEALAEYRAVAPMTLATPLYAVNRRLMEVGLPEADPGELDLVEVESNAPAK